MPQKEGANGGQRWACFVCVACIDSVHPAIRPLPTGRRRGQTIQARTLGKLHSSGVSLSCGARDKLQLPNSHTSQRGAHHPQLAIDGSAVVNPPSPPTAGASADDVPPPPPLPYRSMRRISCSLRSMEASILRRCVASAVKPSMSMCRRCEGERGWDGVREGRGALRKAAVKPSVSLCQCCKEERGRGREKGEAEKGRHASLHIHVPMLRRAHIRSKSGGMGEAPGDSLTEPPLVRRHSGSQSEATYGRLMSMGSPPPSKKISAQPALAASPPPTPSPAPLPPPLLTCSSALFCSASLLPRTSSSATRFSSWACARGGRERGIRAWPLPGCQVAP